MDYKKLQEDLKQYTQIKKEIANQQERLERFASLLYSPKISNMGGTGRKSNYIADVMSDRVAAKIGLEVTLQLNINKLMKHTEMIEKQLEEIDNSLQREILRLRYFDNLNWIDVGYAVNYDARHCRRLCKQILEA